jgi:hypothetical protein
MHYCLLARVIGTLPLVFMDGIMDAWVRCHWSQVSRLDLRSSAGVSSSSVFNRVESTGSPIEPHGKGSVSILQVGSFPQRYDPIAMPKHCSLQRVFPT